MARYIDLNNGRPENKTYKCIYSDGNLGHMNFPFDIVQYEMKDATMRLICQEITKKINNNQQIPEIIISASFELDKEDLENRPIENLKNVEDEVIRNLVNSVVQPVRDLSALINLRGGKLAVCSLIPRPANLDCLTHPAYSDVLSLAFLKCNEKLNDINANQQQLVPNCIYVSRDIEYKNQPMLSGQRRVKMQFYENDHIHLNQLGKKKVQGVILRVLHDF